MIKAALFVFVGGGLGSLLRYGISSLFSGLSERFPYGTLVANIVSCLLLGFLIGLTSKNVLSPQMKLFLMVGLCGGFSTFSTFSAESYQMFHTGQMLSAFLYMAASFIICLAAIYIGLQWGVASIKAI